MADPEKIVYLHKEGHTPDEIVDLFKKSVPDGFSLTFSSDKEPDEQRRALIADADYIIIYGRPFEDIDVAKKAKILQVLSAGFDRFDLDQLREAGLPVCNNGGANAPTVAEQVILFILALNKKFMLHHQGLQNGKWIGHVHAMDMYELRGKQLGIIGFGNIGREVARLTNGFLAKPVFCDEFDVPEDVKKEFNATQMSFEELISTSDVVTAHVPLNDSTRGMINRDVFKKMKNSAYYIATSRGPVTKEADLIAALDAGDIAGAGIDVFEDEPTSPDNPLLGRDNVVTTPHNAGTSIDTWIRRMEFGYANIVRVSKGEKPLAIVNGL
ncbi:MAG: NAD(P)-dependent oxidoreductase [Rhodospirillaceae bacterium]|jgi:phosphoglycerate dehydrogenase-like enzyme